MAVVQPCPFLIAEDDEIQLIKPLQARFDSRRIIGIFLQIL
jgi:hypothetical protein